MILPSRGEIGFDDGLRIAAHSPISRLFATIPAKEVSTNPLPIEGWSHHKFGEHPCSYSRFLVEVTTGIERRVEGVFLSHRHSFYDAAVPDDSERRTFYEGIIAQDLRGQREFNWGNVFCRFDKRVNRDWLAGIYSPRCDVPLHERK